MSDHEPEATCNSCGFSGTLDDFDVLGACPGNLFCNQCGVEFNAETGDPSLLCGKCFGCESLKESGLFEGTQASRVLELAEKKGMTTTKPEGDSEGSDSPNCLPSFRNAFRPVSERVEKREDDAIEYEFVRQAAEDALRLLNACMDSGIRARGFTKWFRSGNATFRLQLQCVERVESSGD